MTHKSGDNTLDLDDGLARPRAYALPTSTPKSETQGTVLAKPRPPGLLPDNRKLPPKPAPSTAKNVPSLQAAAAPQARPPEPAKVNIGPDRVKQIHRDLLEAKAKTADAGQVSLNALTRKLEAAVKSLGEKHAGKRIDFVVVIKDGKAIVKPIIR
jgi:hypothetical protein